MVVAKQAGEEVLPTEQDLTLVGEMSEERALGQARSVRDLGDGRGRRARGVLARSVAGPKREDLRAAERPSQRTRPKRAPGQIISIRTRAPVCGASIMYQPPAKIPTW
jgi:hypothetical protein